MIQRIQTVYLLLAVIALSIFGYYKVNTLAIVDNSFYLFVNGFAAFLLAFVLLITTFLYKKRKLQLTIVRISLAAVMINLPLLFLIQTPTTVLTNYSNLFLLATFIFLFFAHNNIDKDEKLIKSLNRLR